MTILVEICGLNMGRQYICDTMEEARAEASNYIGLYYDVYIDDKRIDNGAERRAKYEHQETDAYEDFDVRR